MDEIGANISTYSNNTQSEQLSSHSIFYIALEMVVSILCIFGNMLVIISFYSEKYLRTVTNVYIYSLALTDLLVGVAAIPIYLYSMVTGWPADLITCLLINSLIMMLCTVSIFHLLSVSFDRYIVIVHNNAIFGVISQRRRRTSILIAFSWIAGCVIGLLPLIGWNRGHQARKTKTECIFIEVMDMRYLMFIYFGTIITPTVIIIIFYSSIYKVIAKQASIAHRLLRGKQKEQRISRNNRVIFSLFLLVTFFLFCWYPLYTLNAIITFNPSASIPQIWFFVTIVLSHISSAINPLIYAYTMPGFQQAFRRVLLCCRGASIKATIDEENLASNEQTNRFKRSSQSLCEAHLQSTHINKPSPLRIKHRSASLRLNTKSSVSSSQSLTFQCSQKLSSDNQSQPAANDQQCNYLKSISACGDVVEEDNNSE